MHAQDSCACTRFSCMHKTLVHAQDSCACTRLFSFFTCVYLFLDFNALVQNPSRMVREDPMGIPNPLNNSKMYLFICIYIYIYIQFYMIN